MPEPSAGLGGSLTPVGVRLPANGGDNGGDGDSDSDGENGAGTGRW